MVIDMTDGGNILPDNWVEKERKRQSPNHWVEDLRPQIMERIKYYEKFLEKWGLTAQAGIEQEFYPIPKDGVKIEEAVTLLNATPKKFIDSPYVEKIYHDNDYQKDPTINKERDDENKLKHGITQPHEGVIGSGNGKNKKTYPHNSLTPSHIVVAAENFNKTIKQYPESQAENPYKLKDISFDEVDETRRLQAQQVSISLWDKNREYPKSLFDGFNEIGRLCTKNLLNTQNAMMAFLTVNDRSFNRFNATEDYYQQRSKRIMIASSKTENPSVLFREKNGDRGREINTRIENRLGNSDMPPSVNMLITLAGIAKGVEEYITKYNIKTPDELSQHLAENNKYYFDMYADLPKYDLPKTQKESISVIENSTLAQTILGEDLHREFVEKYKKECLRPNKPTTLSVVR